MSYIPVIDAARLANNAVTSAKVLNNELVSADINASAGILFTQLESVPWHAGNDGAGSGLDADLLDAQSGSYYLARTNHTGTQTASTISDFDTQVRTSRLDQMAAPTASVSMNSQKITSLADPTVASDAANKGYVDAIATGLIDYKASVRAVSTANITLSGLQTVDGVSLVDGDRVLVGGQTTAADNGIRIASAGAWARSTDADTSGEVNAGLYTAVEEGTLYHDSVWLLATDNPITLNTTALSFIQLPSLQDLVAGAGITKTGNTIDVGAGTGITVNANDVAIDTAIVARKTAANTFQAAQTFASAVVFNAGEQSTIALKSANYSIDLATDQFLSMDTSGASRTFTLPASHSAGQKVYLKRVGANSCVIATSDSDTIDGDSGDLTLTQDYETALLISDGTNWLRF